MSNRTLAARYQVSSAGVLLVPHSSAAESARAAGGPEASARSQPPKEKADPQPNAILDPIAVEDKKTRRQELWRWWLRPVAIDAGRPRLNGGSGAAATSLACRSPTAT